MARAAEATDLEFAEQDRLRVKSGQAEWQCQLDMGQEVRAKLMSSSWKWTCWPQLKALTGGAIGSRLDNHQAKDWGLGLILSNGTPGPCGSPGCRASQDDHG